MSERGVFAVDRGLWSDPDFADETFSEREAFLWILSEAAWRPTRVRIGHHQVDLARGQCAFSTRFMAEKWKWSEARVRRYLGRLIAAEIICTRTDKIATHVTILKYDRFQRVSLPEAEVATHTRRTSDAPATQVRRKEEDRENKTSSLRSESGSGARRRPQVPVDPEWQLSQELVTVAENCGLNAEQAAAEWPRFIDHALRDDVRHRDWVAAWRTWCRSPYRKAGAARASPRAGTADFWAADARDAHHSLQRGRHDEGPFDRSDAGCPSAGDTRGYPSRPGPHRGSDRASAQPSGADPRELPPLRLVGGP